MNQIKELNPEPIDGVIFHNENYSIGTKYPKLNWLSLKSYIENNISFLKPQQYTIIDCNDPKNKCGHYINKELFDKLENPYDSKLEEWYYIIFSKLINLRNKIFTFIYNVLDFKKELSLYSEYDFEDSLMMFKRGLELLLKRYRKVRIDWEGKEEQQKQLQQIYKLINRMSKGYDHYYELAEKICGKYYDLRKKDQLAKQLFKKDKNKLFLLWDYIYHIWI